MLLVRESLVVLSLQTVRITATLQTYKKNNFK